ncbi:LytS/YhcK type 5TM receptor domain-containing protein [Marispirochaeta aestuarii]|uniref:LytS/YhcK type 5TM receptor domain-containing protein n=1 Tax=Marispirochaeta aestuarii TaxID=1963862 RepID=UPI0029C90B40|nr:LytS/YhcK type 5TM receptor domain-containing protein [Marispirochaeta aestuarii]
MIILDLVHNIALLVALTVGYEQIHTRLKRENPFFSLLTGLLFACVGLVGMMTPMVFAPGVIYDGRSIVLSAAGYICGPAAAFIAAAITAAYRIYLGGAGVLAGVLSIIESAMLGTLFFFLRKRNPVWQRPVNLWFLGLAVHATMLLCQLTLPGSLGISVIRSIGVWVMLLYPPALVVILLLFLKQQELIRTKSDLRTSETWYRSLFEDTFAPRLILNPADGRILDANQAAVNFYGWSRDELCTMRVPDINTLSKKEILEEMRFAAENKKNYFEFRHRLKDGSLRDVAVFSSSVQLPEVTILNSVIIDITEQKEVETRLMHALRQKDSLLQEVHHRVRNNLALIASLIDLQLEDTDTPDREKSGLKITGSRVHALSMIHNLLYQNEDLSLLNFTQFLRVLAETLPAAGGKAGSAGIEVHGKDLTLDVHYAMPLGLMVHELLLNILGESDDGPGNIRLRIDFYHDAGGVYHIVFRNTGETFTSIPMLNTDKSLSRELVRQLASQINGSTDFLPEPDLLAMISFSRSGEGI